MQFAPMPSRIETARLILTPEEQSDAGWLTELFNERGGKRFEIDEVRGRIAAMRATITELGIGVLVLRRRVDADPLGYCGLVVGRASVSEPELAYELLPRAQRQGFATEAAGAVLDAAFATGRNRVWATVRPWNAPSFRVLDKLGFHRDHTTTDDRGEVVWLVRDRRAGDARPRRGNSCEL